MSEGTARLNSIFLAILANRGVYHYGNHQYEDGY